MPVTCEVQHKQLCMCTLSCAHCLIPPCHYFCRTNDPVHKISLYYVTLQACFRKLIQHSSRSTKVQLLWWYLIFSSSIHTLTPYSLSFMLASLEQSNLITISNTIIQIQNDSICITYLFCRCLGSAMPLYTAFFVCSFVCSD